MKVLLRSKKVDRILTRMNKSQNWLAHKMEMSSAYMSQMMTGYRFPSPKTRTRMMRVLKGQTFDDLFIIKTKGERPCQKKS